MPIADLWGGEWTDDKLRVLRGYLHAYLTALKDKPFRLGYIDAFAGSGRRKAPKRAGNQGQLALAQDLADPYRVGSARVALDLDPGFHAYVFIEKSAKKVEELEDLAAQYPDKQVRVERGDANARLRHLCGLDWSGLRAVVFLDPFGMQVEWDTMEALASTKAVDVWVLVPVAIAVNRLLPANIEDARPEWTPSLDRFFGTENWRGALYESMAERAQRHGPTLFDAVEPQDDLPDAPSVKSVGLDDIAAYYIERLRTIFPTVAPKHLVLRHPRGQQLFALCFAAANPNPAASRASLRIARHLLEK